MAVGIRPNFSALMTAGLGSLEPSSSLNFSLQESVAFETMKLMGPVVTPLLRNPDGILDMSKVPVETLSELKPYLIDQAQQQHPRRARDYQTVLSQSRFSPLLEILWNIKTGGAFSLPIDNAANVLDEFSAAIGSVGSAVFQDRYAASPTAIGGFFRTIGGFFKRQAPHGEAAVNFKKLLRQKGYKLKKDRELQSQLQETLHLMTGRDLVTLIQKIKKFDNQPTHISDTYPGQYLGKWSGGRKVYWHDLRDCLQQLPHYYDLTNTLGLTYEESVALLFDTIDALKSNPAHISRDVFPPLISIFEGLIERDFGLRDDLPVFREVLAATKKRWGGDLSRAMRIIGLAVNAGIPFDRSMELVLYICEHAAIAGYAFMYLDDELNSLRTTAADGETLFQALINISGKDPYFSGANYATFAELMYVAATHTTHSQQQILERLNAEADRRRSFIYRSIATLKPGNDPESGTGLEVFRKLLPRSAGDATSGVPAVKEAEDYFPRLAVDKLVHGIFPYRIHRGYRAGLTDLQKMMKEELAEGAWVYDQDRQQWYSLGGRSFYSHDRVRTEFFPYDISKLSQRPELIHIHPKESEIFIVIPAEALALPQFQKKLTKYSTSMPSKSDFEALAFLLESSSQSVPLSALIVHSIGITEVRIPRNADRVRKFASTFRDLETAILVQFDFKRYYKRYGIKEDDLVFVRKLAARLNAQLPEGFEIIVHDFDEYLNNIE